MRDYSTAGVDPTISSLEIEAQERLLTKIKPSLWLKSTGSRTKVFSQSRLLCRLFSVRQAKCGNLFLNHCGRRYEVNTSHISHSFVVHTRLKGIYVKTLQSSPQW